MKSKGKENKKMRVDYKILFPASKNKMKKERKIGHVEI